VEKGAKTIIVIHENFGLNARMRPRATVVGDAVG
jgi:hypothetical protein